LPGDEALAWGFFNRLCAPASLLDEAHAFARALAGGPTFRTRDDQEDAAPGVVDGTRRGGSRRKPRRRRSAWGTHDFRRAYEAFAAKRTPVFEGN